MLTKRNIIKKFHKAALEENLEKRANPGIGWYHLYTFDAGCSEPELYIACEEEEIVLLLINIGAFRGEKLSADALMSVRQIFHFFAENQKDMIVRFTYDTEGKGMEREPERGEMLLEHIRQLGVIIKEYHSQIMAVQGILAGSWGEMHGSKFVSEKWLIRLAEEMLEATEYSCQLAVRKPEHLRGIAKALGKKAEEKLTLFNDGIFGSETDLGTYEASPKEREMELSWQYEKLKYRYVGGEALVTQNMAGQTYMDGRRAAEDFKRMHISYLNSVYQRELLDYWKKEEIMWQQKRISSYEYLGAHLGYRFLVRDVKWKKNRLLIQIENTGFANLCEDAICSLQICTENGRKEREVKADPKKWESQKESALEIRLEKEEQKKGTRYFLQLYRKKDGRQIQFANKDAENGVLLGKF